MQPLPSASVQPTTAPDNPSAGTSPAASGSEATITKPQSIDAAAAPQEQISILGPEPREIDFPKFDLVALEIMSESERRQHADSMELPALGSFIRPARIGIKRLVEACRPYVESFMERTAHQGKRRMLTNGKGQPASRDEVVREHLGVGIRRVN